MKPLPPDDDPPAAPTTPEQALAGLRIASRHPLALKHALAWSRVLASIAKGADDRAACRVARIPERTWREWKTRGRDRDASGKPKSPESPFDELLAAYNEAKGQVAVDLWSALYTQAVSKRDVRAIETLLRRQEAQEKAKLESALGKLTLEQKRLEVAALRAEAAKRGEGKREIFAPGDPGWEQLQREVFGSARQGLSDARAPRDGRPPPK